MNTIKKDFNINELFTLEGSITILRACPAIPFDVANNINANLAPIKAITAKYNEQNELIRERHTALCENKDTTPEALKYAQTNDKKALIDLLKVKHAIKLTVLPLSLFSGLNISGDKVVKLQDGSTNNLPYRDAYFDLLGLGLIA